MIASQKKSAAATASSSKTSMSRQFVLRVRFLATLSMAFVVVFMITGPGGPKAHLATSRGRVSSWAKAWSSPTGKSLTFQPAKNREAKVPNIDDNILKEVGFNFEDPKGYKGPISKDWPPSRSRNTASYIRPEDNTILSGNTRSTLHVERGFKLIFSFQIPGASATGPRSSSWSSSSPPRP